MSFHINAQPDQIAETVLLPGDPKRAKWMAETFLENPVCYNAIRGMLGYTGSYQGKKVSIQGTGMGAPSLLIYGHELITEYGAKKLIRVGSAGAYQPHVKIHDIVLAMAASHDSNLSKEYFGTGTFAPTADGRLFMKALDIAKHRGIALKTGNVLSNDRFYPNDSNQYKKWAAYGVLCVDMETAGLYILAAQHGVQALSLLTISDSILTKEEISAQARETSFTQMVSIALGLV